MGGDVVCHSLATPILTIHSENELSLSLYNPPPPPLLGQTNQAAEVLAVQTTLTTFRHQNIGIITDSDWVFCWARKWRARGWVSNTSPVSYPQLCDSVLHSIDTHQGIFEWCHVPSHQDIPSNQRAKDLAEAGHLQHPLNFELFFNVPSTPDGVMEHTEDTHDFSDLASRPDFDALSTSARSHLSDTVSIPAACMPLRRSEGRGGAGAASG